VSEQHGCQREWAIGAPTAAVTTDVLKKLVAVDRDDGVDGRCRDHAGWKYGIPTREVPRHHQVHRKPRRCVGRVWWRPP